MGDDVGRRPLVGAGLFVEGSHAKDVIDVSVREDRAVQRLGAPRANLLVHFFRGEDRARIDHDQSVVGVKDTAVAEVRQESHALRDLGEMTTLTERAGFVGRFLTAPQAIGEFNNVHALLVGVGRFRFGRVGGRGVTRLAFL